VGQKIDLEYNIETMRITDPGLDADSGTGPAKVSSIMSQINRKTTEADDAGKFERATGTPAWEQTPKVTGEVNSNRLKSMLAGLKKTE
jgi:hypothetical protein